MRSDSRHFWRRMLDENADIMAEKSKAPEHWNFYLDLASSFYYALNTP